MTLVPCSSHPGAGWPPARYFICFPREGKGRTPHSSWFTPRTDTCLCAYIWSPTNTVRRRNTEHLVFSGATGMWACVLKGERTYYKTNAEVLYNWLQYKTNHVWDQTMTQLPTSSLTQHSLCHSTCWQNMEQWTEKGNHICLVITHIWNGYSLPAWGSSTTALC